ncbi:MAG: hypothetical protein NT062_09530 [Proteobacteria bacterium]|nr:hypothetical protein [Pseudomonadota bacterium]
MAQRIGARRGNAHRNSKVTSARTIVPIVQGTSTPREITDSPAHTLIPRQAVIAASTRASTANTTLSRCFEPRKISVA